MKKTASVVLAIILCCVFMLSSCDFADGIRFFNNVHKHKFSEWEIVTTPTCTTVGKQERFCSCGEKETSDVPALGHTAVANDNIISVCTKWSAIGGSSCSVCQMPIDPREYISPVGHSYIGGICTICGNTRTDYSDISLYTSHESDDFFANVASGEAMHKLYEEMESVLSRFHTGSDNAVYYTYNSELGDLYTVAKFDYAKYGLSLEEAQTVYTIFRKDHPVYYWMSYWLYWNNNMIIVTTTEEYANGALRQSYNEILYKGIEEYALLTEGETSAYNIALILYDAILKNNFYAYTDNRAPEPAQWAHSIMGDFLYDSFVCEGYAKLFQLLLNLNGIENMYIVGTAGESHCWNLVRMDDGNWYWFDLTWGDTTAYSYYYFCTLDSTMKKHIPTPFGTYGLYANTILPERADSPFACDDVMKLGDTFSIGDSYFCLSAPNTVTLKSGPAISGDKLVYRGVVYNIAG